MNYYLKALQKYKVFNERTSRKEYWMFVLFNIIIGIVINILDAVIGAVIGIDIYDKGILSVLYSLILIVPALAITVRRLHDTNHSAWWYLILLVPVIGAIVFLIFMIKDSSPEDNKYGPSPKKLSAV